jgi:hypothetical protein
MHVLAIMTTNERLHQRSGTLQHDSAVYGIMSIRTEVHERERSLMGAALQERSYQLPRQEGIMEQGGVSRGALTLTITT